MLKRWLLYFKETFNLKKESFFEETKVITLRPY